MGRSRKYSRGHRPGFLMDDRVNVEIIGESEGLGSSGQVDNGMRWKGVSVVRGEGVCFGGDGCDSFGIPIHVLSLSKMSRSERKSLEFRLRMELEQVKVLQRKVSCLCSNAGLLSPSSDVRSCSVGQKMSSAHKNGNWVVSHGNRVQGKEGFSKRVGRAKLPPPVSNVALMKQCETLLKRLMSHNFSWIFNSPVDAVALNIPDYFTVIKRPMDLGTVKKKLLSLAYSSPLDFAADVRLTFANAMKYNPPSNDVHSMAVTLSKQFESRWKTIERKIPITIDETLSPARIGVVQEIETSAGMPPLKKSKVMSCDSLFMSEPVLPPMSIEEKQNLILKLEPLLSELPKHIEDLLREQCANGVQADDGEVEIDVDALSNDAWFKLQKLVDNYILEKQKKLCKSEPCEMELPNESGFSNSSLQPGKEGHVPAEEDMETVCGNEAPTSNCQHFELERIEANNKLKNRTSPCSNGGTSSNDSVSGNVSRHQLDAGKTTSLPIVVEENSGANVVNLEQKRSSIDEKNSKNGLLHGGERNSPDKPMAAKTDGCQEGESAPPERQVSPGKLHRAALMKNRFADTILKAREKVLEKSERRNSEKLRLEREELERWQKEEKARLQAEAKMAGEARRKAEAEALAEVKRKRELEREAARLALQQMEKTVEINENSKFMEDLERLRTAHDEKNASLLEDASPTHSLGSFNFQASSNPLEQLGLYMKRDDDLDEDDNGGDGEEDDAAPQQPNSLHQLKDAEEEGETD